MFHLCVLLIDKGCTQIDLQHVYTLASTLFWNWDIYNVSLNHG